VAEGTSVGVRVGVMVRSNWVGPSVDVSVAVSVGGTSVGVGDAVLVGVTLDLAVGVMRGVRVTSAVAVRQAELQGTSRCAKGRKTRAAGVDWAGGAAPSANPPNGTRPAHQAPAVISSRASAHRPRCGTARSRRRGITASRMAPERSSAGPNHGPEPAVGHAAAAEVAAWVLLSARASYTMPAP
jgi:hypothetical protein